MNKKLHFSRRQMLVYASISLMIPSPRALAESGVINIGDQLQLGPYYGKFYKIVIKSIHNNFRESINELYGGNSGCINFKFINPR